MAMSEGRLVAGLKLASSFGLRGTKKAICNFRVVAFGLQSWRRVAVELGIGWVGSPKT